MKSAPIPSVAAAELLARFRRQRPLRGGSLIVTIFGDAILPRGGAISLGSLIQLVAPFGLNERLVRTSAARLAQDGTLEARRSGKLSEYRLSTQGRERFAEATRRIYSKPDGSWSGRWTLAVLPPLPAAERNALRDQLLWRGFGELSATVFAHPELAASPGWRHAVSGSLADALFFDANLSDDDTPSRLVTLGWNLHDLGLRYQRFLRRFEHVLNSGRESRIDDASCFVIRTLLIHEYRRLHLRDPLLPDRLLPKDWPGSRAAAVCRDIYAQVFAGSERHLSGVAMRLEGPLPPPDASVMQRFGGIATSPRPATPPMPSPRT